MGTAGYSLSWFTFASLLVLAITANEKGRLHRLFTAKPLLLLGKYSYCLYLVHSPVRSLIKYRIFNPLNSTNSLGAGSLGQILFSALCLMASVIVAHISYQFFEQKILSWKDRLAPLGKPLEERLPQKKEAA